MAMRDRLASLFGEIARLEGTLTDLVWRCIPLEETEEIQTLASEARATTPQRMGNATRDELSAAMDTVEKYQVALQALLRRLPEIETAYLRVPQDPPELPVPLDTSWFANSDPASFEKGRRRIVAMLAELDPRADIRHADNCVSARYSREGVPLILRYDGTTACDEWGGMNGFFISMAMATSVALATPSLSLRPELGRHTYLLKPLGLARDLETEHEEFDNLFLIDATEEAARVVLTDEVRGGLLAVARSDVPRFDVEEGRAVVTWRFEPTRPAIEGATRALTALRKTPLAVSLRRPT